MMRVSIFTGLGEMSVEIITHQFVRALLAIAGDKLNVEIYRPLDLWRKRFGDTPFGRVAFYLGVGLLYGIVARGKQGTINHVMDNRYGHLVHFLDVERTVVTSHGGTPRSFHHILGVPYRFQLRFFEWATQGMLKARKIFIVSSYSKKELLRDYKVDPDKVLVLYPGVAPYFSPPSLEQRRKVRAYLGIGEQEFVLLHVGHSGPRKNIEVVLKALPILRSRVNRPILFLHVGQDFTSTQKQLIKELDIAEMTRAWSAIPHESLPRFYHAADLFVFPSWYEGFGMPLIEAMASGLPVVCSDYELFHEVAGDAALFFPPFEPLSLADIVEEVLNSAELSQQLTQGGLQRAGVFSWHNYAAQVLEVYNTIVRGAR